MRWPGRRTSCRNYPADVKRLSGSARGLTPAVTRESVSASVCDADEWTRTTTTLRPLAPEASASTNSATSACGKGDIKGGVRGVSSEPSEREKVSPGGEPSGLTCTP